ncbi:MAG TPA: hypothetical protein VMS71_04090, partial [Candidatus Acidoferrum sp.]|nr:hypothetical protein [Candidatus Acidoferrum sp.]
MARKHRSRKKAEFSGSLGSFLLKNAAKILFGLVLIVVVLTLAQCTIKKPEAPTWETQLTVPLINRTYHMDELIRRMDQKGIEMVGDSIRYSLSYDLDTVMLNSDNLDASDISSSFSKELGRITLNTPTVTPLTFAASSIPLLSLVFPGTVPPTSFPLMNDFAGISDFSSARISSGQMYVVITNNLGIPIDALTLQLYDVLNSQAIDTHSLTRTLNDGSSDSLLFDLSGKMISDSLRVIANCHTPGGTVLSAANKEVITAIH